MGHSLKYVDNIGVYLSCYLGDMELSELHSNEDIGKNPRIKEITAIKNNGDKTSKYVIKGKRLALYPKSFRLWRASRQIKRPIVIKCNYSDAMEIVSKSTLTYEKTLHLEFDNGQTNNIINYKYYNIKPKKFKEGK